jgi:hypothetical protein
LRRTYGIAVGSRFQSERRREAAMEQATHEREINETTLLEELLHLGVLEL